MFDDQMIYASKDKRIVNLFTLGAHHRNLSVIYIVKNVFHQGKGSRSIKKRRSLLGAIQEPSRQMYPYGYLYGRLRITKQGFITTLLKSF